MHIAMKNPPHPGELIREDIIGALGLTISRAAGILGVIGNRIWRSAEH